MRIKTPHPQQKLLKIRKNNSKSLLFRKQEGFFVSKSMVLTRNNPPSGILLGELRLHCAGEMIAQHIEQLHFRRAVHGNSDAVALTHAQAHDLHGAGEICAAGTHFQGAGGIGIALGQFCQTAGRAKQHGKFVLQGIGESLDKITP